MYRFREDGAVMFGLRDQPWVADVKREEAELKRAQEQGREHGQEAVPPEPYTSPLNAVARILLEQWITFPRFVLSGGWARAMRNTARAA
jgi:hypothetical protein